MDDGEDCFFVYVLSCLFVCQLLEKKILFHMEEAATTGEKISIHRINCFKIEAVFFSPFSLFLEMSSSKSIGERQDSILASEVLRWRRGCVRMGRRKRA